MLFVRITKLALFITRTLESMLLFSFLLLIPRICISLGCRAGDRQWSQSVRLLPHGTDANHHYKQIQCYCRTVWAPASLFLLKFYFTYCQCRGSAMLSSLLHVCAFASLAVPPSRLSCWAAAWVHLQNPIFYGIWITAAKKLGHCSYFGEAEGCWGRDVPVLNLLNIVAASHGGFWTTKSLAGKGSAHKSRDVGSVWEFGDVQGFSAGMWCRTGLG